MGKEIVINYAEIINAENKLKKMQTNLDNRTSNVTFAKSKGDTVDKLVELANQMGNAKNQLAKLYGSTASALAATRGSFNTTDNTVANYFDILRVQVDEK